MAVLLIPGFMLDEDLWRDVLPALADIGPLVNVDLSKDASIKAMARRAIADAPDTFILIGFSMGGYVAREIARQSPDRVRALILIATSARGDTDLQRQRKTAVPAQLSSNVFKGLSSSAVESSLHPDNADRTDLVERIQSMSERLGGDVFRRQSLLDRHDERGQLLEIRCPCLIVAGDVDRLRSRTEAEELNIGIEGSVLKVIEGTGHMVPLEAPRTLAATIRKWLATVAV